MFSKMADSEVSRPIRSSFFFFFFYKSDCPASVEECQNCLELNNKCTRALKEIISLNLTINLLINELKLNGNSANLVQTNLTRATSRKITMIVWFQVISITTYIITLYTMESFYFDGLR